MASPSSSQHSNIPISLLMLGSAVGGAVLTLAVQKLAKKPPNPEMDHSIGHQLVWKSIGGAMNAAMMYTGDKLGLYTELRQACETPGSSVNAIELAQRTGLSQRWLREWLAQQAAMGVLQLLPGKGDDDVDLHYRLPKATSNVLADPDSQDYDISMIQVVPALVNRAKTMLPEAFATGIGRPYDEPDVAEAIDRHHRRHVRDVFLPLVLPKAVNGKVLQMLQQGCSVVDLGCGAGMMLLALAQAFPHSTFHGYEISKVALEKAAFNIAAARIPNVFLHDANESGESLRDHPQEYDLAVVYDVLHDSTHPMDLIEQVKIGLKPNGIWLLADIPAAPTIRDNLAKMPAVETYFAFSTCLCMSCALSKEGGAGLGTLGFSVPVASQMLTEGGFESIEVLLEKDNARWFLVR